MNNSGIERPGPMVRAARLFMRVAAVARPSRAAPQGTLPQSANRFREPDMIGAGSLGGKAFLTRPNKPYEYGRIDTRALCILSCPPPHYFAGLSSASQRTSLSLARRY